MYDKLSLKNERLSVRQTATYKREAKCTANCHGKMKKYVYDKLSRKKENISIRQAVK